jgi:PPOX class probable F420-dependent enzyme
VVEIPASHRDLLEKCQVVILATIGPDDFPQVTAIWFLVEDGVIKTALNNTRQKTKNLQRRPECSLFFIDPDTPYRTLEIRARADLQPDPDFVVVDALSTKYGADMRSFDPPGQFRFAATFTPVKVNTYGE